MRTTVYPKVVVIGAGSLFFGRQAIWQMTHSQHLRSGCLALVDTDAERLDKMAKLAQLVAAATGAPLKIEAHNDWKDALPGADFVVLSFAVDTVRYRGLDCEISARYGVRMCSGDTIGPGGIMRALRDLPAILECAADVARLCPDAWLINYINPSAVNGMALARFAPQVKSFALCDSLHMPHVKIRYAILAGLIDHASQWHAALDADFDLRIAGVNHFTWLLRADYRGRDFLPEIADAIRRRATTGDQAGKGAKQLHNDAITCQLSDIFGYTSACTAHTKEYVRFYQGRGALPSEIPPLRLWETDARYARHAAMWREVEETISGALPIGDFLARHRPDHATDIIETMAGGLGRPYYINTANKGAVGNLGDDAFLELLCDVDEGGPRPRSVGDMPLGLRGMTQLTLDTHELTAEAVAKGDYNLLRRALMTDPLTTSIEDADAILRDLLAAQRDALPDWV
ncbi:MAG: glycoside hydrolase family 4 [Chloroflexi bacterium]|nr:glycoside hydrolase family 4 [Chloroflexota bacterium]MCY3583026.1 glycoside hydrolase family 4 [Chloroflexota bacterium]MCY3714949.1 glycoside hydrolase family 4 [Chloroflexota bacterium]MXV94126.1 glycoside hydrolase family 4 [Chloroflexota bacterium]MXX84820.1 glycoside hydrolase family 4 [Chloroflexota bacterium]